MPRELSLQFCLPTCPHRVEKPRPWLYASFGNPLEKLCTQICVGPTSRFHGSITIRLLANNILRTLRRNLPGFLKNFDKLGKQWNDNGRWFLSYLVPRKEVFQERLQRLIAARFRFQGVQLSQASDAGVYHHSRSGLRCRDQSHYPKPCKLATSRCESLRFRQYLCCTFPTARSFVIRQYQQTVFGDVQVQDWSHDCIKIRASGRVGLCLDE